MIVLLVDDDLDSRLIYGRVLAHAGYTVLEAVGGLQGLNVARMNRPDVIVVDLGLPDIDGPEVIRCLRADPATRGSAIIVLTAYVSRLDETYATEAGCDVFLTKPLPPRDLVAVIDRIVANRAPTRPAPAPEPRGPIPYRSPPEHPGAASPPTPLRSRSPDLVDSHQ
jgi:DNA-binding response OmpR family regulator